MVLKDDDCALFVDASICISPSSHLWLRECNALVMALGYVEWSDVSSTIPKRIPPRLNMRISITKVDLPMPTLPLHLPTPMVFPRLVLRAIIVSDAPNFDLALWKRALESKEQIEESRISIR